MTTLLEALKAIKIKALAGELEHHDTGICYLVIDMPDTSINIYDDIKSVFIALGYDSHVPVENSILPRLFPELSDVVNRYAEGTDNPTDAKWHYWDQWRTGSHELCARLILLDECIDYLEKQK